ncbi:hypothetical protein JOM56_000567 [Amanita muscaria]
MSFLRRIWQSLRNPVIYAGRDLEGNKFYEYPASSPDPRRARRAVQYKHPNDMWDYIGGGKRLAVQWYSWLSHTRRDPPTIKELEDDLARQIRIRSNASMIEARDNDERARMIEEGAVAVGEARQSRMEHILQESARDEILPPRQADMNHKQGQEEEQPSETGDENETVRQKPQSESTSSPWIEHTEDTLKPQEWTPRSRSRRG